MEIQGVNTTRNDVFPFSALRVLGSLQIALGVGCLVLGVGDLALMMINYDRQRQKYAVTPEQKSRFETLVSMTVASAPVWCGTWFMVTGALGTCVSRARSHSLKFLKIAFLVLSVLCSVFFAPACTVMSCIIAITRHTMDYRNLVWLISTSSAFLAFCEMGIAAVSASICCCCSPLRMAKVHIVFADSEVGPAPPSPVARSNKDEPFHPAPRKSRVREATVQTDDVITPANPPPPQPVPAPPALLPLPPPPRTSLRPSRRLLLQHQQQHLPPMADPRYPILQQRPLDLHHDVDDDEDDDVNDYVYIPPSVHSPGYDRLRKWALPNGRMY